MEKSSNGLNSTGLEEGPELALKRAAQELARVKTELAIAQTKLEVLEKERGIDALTGLFNRRFLEPKLDKLINELNRSEEKRQHNISAIMVFALDINNFKIFNEKPYNHAIGDQALVAFVEHLRQRTESKLDVLFRVGEKSDEFRMIMPIFNDAVNFDELFEKVKKRINSDLIFKPINDSHHITASMGYSVIRKGEKKTAKQLLMEADIREREEKERK